MMALRVRIDKVMIPKVRDEGLKVKFSTHSLRKGGASFWRARGVSEDAVLLQGGWKDPSSLRQVYLDDDILDRRGELARAVGHLSGPTDELKRPPPGPSASSATEVSTKDLMASSVFQAFGSLQPTAIIPSADLPAPIAASAGADAPLAKRRGRPKAPPHMP